MKKFIMTFTVLGLLTACGAQPETGREHPPAAEQEHGDHGNAPAGGEGDGHGGHDGHGEDAMHAEDVQASWTFAGGQPPQSGQDTPVRIEIRNREGRPVEHFDISHEKPLHVIVVSKDLSYFNHIHPEYRGNGVFEITTRFPRGGDYKLIADFIPTGAGPMTKMEWVEVAGEAGKPVPIQPETNLTKTVGGKEVTLSFDQLVAGKELTLTYSFQDAKTKQPITNLQPYLGAIGHVVILTEDAEQYLHVHPLEERATGPEARFMTTFPKSGVYKIWGQFQHEDQVFTVPFVVQVP